MDKIQYLISIWRCVQLLNEMISIYNCDDKFKSEIFLT